MTAYARPSYSDLVARLEADLSDFPAVLCERLAKALAKAGQSQHGYLEWIDKQCSPLTCELERLYDWAALYGVDRLDATAAAGSVLATGTAGTPVLAGTQLRGQNGLDYTVLAAVTLEVGATAISVRCDTAGSAGNMVAGLTLTLIDPVVGVASTMTVAPAGLSGGAEQEDVDAWRARVADEWQVVVTRGARSGKPEDYRFWAKSAHPSVTGALVQPHALGLGTVLVRPICNALVDRLPTAAVLDAVAAYFSTIVPAVADWRVAAPLVRPVVVSIDLLPGYDSAANRTAIQTALNTAVLAEATENAVLALAEIDASVALVTSQYTRVAPTAAIAAAAGEVLVMQPVVWA